MAKQGDGFRLGVAVIVVMVLFVTVVIYIGSGWDRERRVPITVRFAHTLNLPLLKEGADIIAFGQVIGDVTGLRQTEISRPGRSADESTLYLEVKGEVRESIGLREDFRIVAEGPVLGGKGHLRITHRGTSRRSADPARPVYGGTSGFSAAVEQLSAEIDPANPQSTLAAIKAQLDPDDVGSLVAKLHRSMNDLNALSRSAAWQMDSSRQDAIIAKVAAALDNVNVATGRLREQLEADAGDAVLSKVHRALDSLNRGLAEAAHILEENRPVISGAVSNVESATAAIDAGVVPPLVHALDPENRDGLLAQANVAVGQVRAALADINVMTTRARGVVVLNDQKLSRLVSNLAETSDHLKAASEDLRRNPWRLLYRPKPDQVREQAILDAARAFSSAAGRLDDSATQLRALLEAHPSGVPANDPELSAVRDHLLETFEKFRTAEQTLWEQLARP